MAASRCMLACRHVLEAHASVRRAKGSSGAAAHVRTLVGVEFTPRTKRAQNRCSQVCRAVTCAGVSKVKSGISYTPSRLALLRRRESLPYMAIYRATRVNHLRFPLLMTLDSEFPGTRTDLVVCRRAETRELLQKKWE